MSVCGLRHALACGSVCESVCELGHALVCVSLYESVCGSVCVLRHTLV